MTPASAEASEFRSATDGRHGGSHSLVTNSAISLCRFGRDGSDFLPTDSPPESAWQLPVSGSPKESLRQRRLPVHAASGRRYKGSIIRRQKSARNPIANPVLTRYSPSSPYFMDASTTVHAPDRRLKGRRGLTVRSRDGARPRSSVRTGHCGRPVAHSQRRQALRVRSLRPLGRDRGPPRWYPEGAPRVGTAPPPPPPAGKPEPARRRKPQQLQARICDSGTVQLRGLGSPNRNCVTRAHLCGNSDTFRNQNTGNVSGGSGSDNPDLVSPPPRRV